MKQRLTNTWKHALVGAIVGIILGLIVLVLNAETFIIQDKCVILYRWIERKWSFRLNS
jgi:uncharacterized membrane-anchored protein YhcB (DUF1043 family)